MSLRKTVQELYALYDKATQGPWVQSDGFREDVNAPTPSGRRVLMVSMYVGKQDDKAENKANFDLVVKMHAALPELLDIASTHEIVRVRLSEAIDQQQELLEAYRWRDECNQAYCEFHGWHRWGISNTSYVCDSKTYDKRTAARQAIFSNYVNACEEVSRLEEPHVRRD